MTNSVNKNILIVANSKDAFGRPLLFNLLKRGVGATLVDFESLDLIEQDNTFSNEYSKKMPSLTLGRKWRMLWRLYYLVKLLNSRDYDVINIHISRWFYILIYPFVNWSRVVITIYGSDFNGVSMVQSWLMKLIYRKVSKITFTNEILLDKFNQSNAYAAGKTKICRFGLDGLEYVDKNRSLCKADIRKSIGYSENKYIVTCGYNSSIEQQHFRIIDSLKKMPPGITTRCQFVFPLTYGDFIYRDKVKKYLSNSGLDFIILENYLVRDDNAKIKLASDMMLNLLEKDSFSGSMQEFIYAGNLVIVGSWLPYNVLDDAGLTYFKIDQVEEVSGKIQELMDRVLDEFEIDRNVEIIASLSSWDCVIDSWISIYRSVRQ